MPRGAVRPTRLLIVHPFVQGYRADMYGRLTGRLAGVGIDASVADGPPPPTLAARNDAVSAAWTTPVPTQWVEVMGRDVALRRVPRAFDLVIIEQAIKNLESYPLLARQHLGGPRVAMWGHGRSYSTTQGRTAAALKQFLTRRGQWFFAYTQAGADYVVAHGFPRTRTSVLNNTIDTDALAAQLLKVTNDDVAAFQRRQGLAQGRTALFIGGVDQAKGIDFLLESASQAARLLPGFVLLVGGAGRDLPKVQAAQAAGAPVRALGRLDGLEKAIALRASDLLTIPSAIGLVAVDSLVAGRPIITRDNRTHGPEADYLRDGTAVWLPWATTPEQYGQTVVDLLVVPSTMAEMQSACRREAPRYSLDRMVDAFVEGVLAWDDVRRAGL